MKRGLGFTVGVVLVSMAILLIRCGDAPQGNEGEFLTSADSEFDLEQSYATAVNTTILTYPANPSNSESATFTFKCNKKKCAFKCKIDDKSWLACSSPKTYNGLGGGSHTFQVKAKDKVTGLWDKTPAKYSWNIIVIAVKIYAGNYSSCAITDGGGAKCWGDWPGNGSSRSIVPVSVSGLSSGVNAISGGRAHTCALTSSGGVKCWGKNNYGQLGNGNNTDSDVPVNVSGLSSGVVAVSAGDDHTCAVITGGAVKCWGYNDYGQLGDNSLTNRNTPVDVSGLSSGISTISAGGKHTCALTTGGGVKCWGGNYYGQFGNGNNNNSKIPVDVANLSAGVTALSAGFNHTCAILAGGALKCTGENDFGQVGRGTNDFYYNTPQDVTGLGSGVIAVSAGVYHTCALISGGAVKCWGRNNYGQIGNGNNTDVNVPTSVSGLSSGLAGIAGGGWHNCALTSEGAVKCWGYNISGELGNGTFDNSNTPVNVKGFGP